ncbi:cytochrome P450 [Methylobacterium isbiliense]|uniref:Fatty-acid peroxygenase n=1 Tax=Methylobacterium isbiliense TaxID=315478 RepID=A0ABQ4SKM0_9HYPH|nr:cytochrome P450 [Methylobacterium isbiliense]MDN3626716.1 cytochrome P450 [Methylobacterium isbiliense]GJE03779.1 Fatty-acid peroxygenase [Methylobacterium isbiliense]
MTFEAGDPARASPRPPPRGGDRPSARPDPAGAIRGALSFADPAQPDGAAVPRPRHREGIPRDRAPDSTLALLREGYAFIPGRCRAYGSDLFATRLMLTRAICMTGAEAAARFYEPDRFTRRHALPRASFALIQDQGSVMVLDGEAHRWRKAMFLSLMAPAALERLAEATARHWRARARAWAAQERVVLLDEAHVPLTAAVCEWAGLPLTAAEAEARAREFLAMIDGTGSVGPRNWRGHRLRARTERWAREAIAHVREGRREAPPGSAVHVIAHHRDPEGRPLDLTVAGVELINVLRPTVANARYLVFAAHALHLHPETRETLRAGDEADLTHFVHEVRRFYPFIPFIGGRVLAPFEFQGHRFARNDWVLMDLYGTNRDPRLWEAPERFRPERFRAWSGDPNTLIPQGGGAHETGHRCPGEWITLAQMKAVVPLLVREMAYAVPDQDLRIDLGRIPAQPRDRFVIAPARP